jgi:hypothetical protein
MITTGQGKGNYCHSLDFVCVEVCCLVKEHLGKGTARGTMSVHFLDESAVETKAAAAVDSLREYKAS